MTDEKRAKQMNLKKIITESAEVAPLVWNHKHNGPPDILGHAIIMGLTKSQVFRIFGMFCVMLLFSLILSGQEGGSNERIEVFEALRSKIVQEVAEYYISKERN